MSVAAETLLNDLAARGVLLSRNGEKLHVVAPRGTLTPELRATLTERKPDLLAVLTVRALRAKLERLALAEGIAAELVRRLTGADVETLATLTDGTDAFLIDYLHVIRDSDLRERGQRPDDETAPAICRHCGPVWVAPEVAAVAPIVHGWPHVLGCAWCHIENRRGIIPRPTLTP